MNWVHNLEAQRFYRNRQVNTETIFKVKCQSSCRREMSIKRPSVLNGIGRMDWRCFAMVETIMVREIKCYLHRIINAYVTARKSVHTKC